MQYCCVSGEVIDRIDEKILRLLRKDAWLTYAQLGRRVGLSPSATQRRVARLKRDGVIVGARAVTHPTGESQRIYTFVTLHDDSRSGVKSVKSLFQNAPGFVDAHLVIGSADVIATFDCASVEAFSTWAMATIHDHPNIKHCFTYVSLMKLTS